MCGRYVITESIIKTKNIVKKAINIEDKDNYNAHPFQKLPVIKRYKNGNTLENLKWGLTPGWAKGKSFKPLINARLETIEEKISFKKLIKQFRCVAIADGFYEWKRDKDENKPFYFVRKDKKTLFFAGIFDEDSFCLITENASSEISEIHHRQPVILNQNDVNKFLNLEISGSIFLKERKKTDLIFYEVSKDVNKPTNNNLSLIQKIK